MMPLMLLKIEYIYFSPFLCPPFLLLLPSSVPLFVEEDNLVAEKIRIDLLNPIIT